MLYYDVVSEVEPKRQELAAANAKLQEANTTLAAVQQKVRWLEQQHTHDCWLRKAVAHRHACPLSAWQQHQHVVRQLLKASRPAAPRRCTDWR